ncbi:hypothetical protein [Halopiger goleimassiliensis]|uniref:hypothetical protein n=1 Tax=Halopiger goleimassiliensis TaxID=1293048 RepID=UPI000677BB6B|nr:hypothetical protein [Halopiger goleimassiliensis]
MTETSTTFGDWRDRVTYVVANAQLVVLGLLVSVGAAIVWFRPSLPGIPPIVFGWLAALTLLGPPLLALFVQGVRKLRERRMETVFHINAAQDVREKYYVEPAVWDEKETMGPSPYWCDESECWEVREFEWDEDLGQLRVRGAHMSQMQDSALVTFKTLVHDLHEKFAKKWVEFNHARARETRRGLEQQEAVVNAQAEATERGLMEPRGIVAESWEESLEDLREDDDALEVDSLETYAEQERAMWSPEPIGPERPPEQPDAATDGGTDR